MKYIFTLLTLISFGFVFGQNKPAGLLKQAQDKRKTYIDPSKKPEQVHNFARYVNPFIGTGGHGHTYPGAATPFGMMQLSPDTRHEGWDGCSGYHYSDSVIYGFSHTHLSGTGVPDLADVLIVPQQGKAATEPGYSSPKGYGSKFRHSDEKASPGFYQVKLLKNNIDVKLTVSERAGMHAYTFNQAKGKKYILIDLNHRDQLLAAAISSPDKLTVSGYRHSKAWATNQKLFFFLQLQTPYTQSKVIQKDGKYKLLLEFPETTKELLLKIGISAVDEAGAKLNLTQEIPDWDFEALKAATFMQWNRELNRINFEAKDPEVMTNFYTSLYHSYLCPTLFSDVDGRYLGMDGQIHQETDHTQYSVFSLWDTYRAAHPLYTLTQTDRTNSFINTFLRHYEQGGNLPVWELVGNETDCMIGYHSVSVILDAYRKGIRGFDAQLALKAMNHTATLDKLGRRQYEKDGFLSVDSEPESVSKTLEYAYDDWCISAFAQELNNKTFYDMYLQRSYNFLNLYDPESKFMRARRDGQWVASFNPAEVNFNYTEANSWQYSMAAPQHLSTLRQLVGGKDSLQSWLDRLFTGGSALAGRQQADITGLIGQYAHGNEPSHHMAYLYNYTNQPYKTQQRVDQILKEMYRNAPDGLAGNEDCGQMSAWYVLSAIGIYPVCPGSPVYAIGRPMQEKASIQLDNGGTFVIRTDNNSPENKYIQSMTLNGKPYTALYITHADIVKGGELRIAMGNQPNEALKTYRSEIPEQEVIPAEVIAVPYFTAVSRTFTDSVSTEIKTLKLKDVTLHYTVDGSEPTSESPVYNKPLTFYKSTLLKAKTFAKGAASNGQKTVDKAAMANNGILDGVHFSIENKSVSTQFIQTDNNRSIEVLTTYANQYAGGGKNALIDGLRGNNDYRSGDWQGYEGIDAQGVIRFEVPDTFQTVSISCLQDEKSWIFIPTEWIVEYSMDGEHYSKLPVVKNMISPTREGAFSNLLTIKLAQPISARYIRYTAKNRGTCPKGHISAGERSWIFVDEVVFE
jgi:predicted alpha-1,2-mannosidase